MPGWRRWKQKPSSRLRGILSRKLRKAANRAINKVVCRKTGQRRGRHCPVLRFKPLTFTESGNIIVPSAPGRGARARERDGEREGDGVWKTSVLDFTSAAR